MIETALILAIFIGAILIIWQLFAMVGDMAEDRGQDRFLWQVVALFINPVMAMLVLWVFCDVDERPPRSDRT